MYADKMGIRAFRSKSRRVPEAGDSAKTEDELDRNSTPQIKVPNKNDIFRYSETHYEHKRGDSIFYNPYPNGRGPKDYKEKK